jgi:hypothetical protein
MGWLSKLFTGIDLDQEEQRTKELQAWQTRLDTAPRMEAVWTPDDWLTHQNQLAAESQTLDPATYSAQVQAAAVEGAKEGLAATAAASRDAVNTLAGSVLPGTIRAVVSFLPWWVWLVALAWIGWRFGAFGMLEGLTGQMARTGVRLWKS